MLSMVVIAGAAKPKKKPVVETWPDNTVMDACIAFWYAPSKGRRHTAVKCEGRLRAQIANMQIGFRGAEAVNTVLEVGEKGGDGYLRDPRINIGLVRKDDTVYKDYLQGVVHAP